MTLSSSSVLGSSNVRLVWSRHSGVRVVRTVGQPVEDRDRLRARVEAELRDQGLPVPVEPEAVDRICALLGGEDERKRERRLATVQQQLAELEFRWKPGAHQEL
jgi:hypothetical protein